MESQLILKIIIKTPLELIRTENAEEYRKKLRAKRNEYLGFQDDIAKLWNTPITSL